jgi:hypothetical protein
VVRGARRDVGERPGRLELQRGVVLALEELDEARDDALRDDLLDRGVALWVFFFPVFFGGGDLVWKGAAA